ncbi:MAG: valine--tRNA ligase [Candidatus Levybacteria bacterium RIFCSPHIGHO2_02_FULL_37_13]|nr:MAG: valine--tRNA ligase [Candidatus Levybacteria bacterium RIFCSPHIGHO2_02_FULL_37_13]
MDKVYDHKSVEEKIYKEWERKGYFKPEINPKGKPYSIILPPPNANGALHFGHAMFTVEDILIRYHRMKGDSCLWLPGTDHAGIETQFVFEKKLKQIGKSRLDFDQGTLYKMIWEYVEEHRGGIQNQLRKLGFSLDWSREKYTLDPDIIKLVYKTFKKMYDEGLVYRDFRLVNYCTFDGTSFSDLEVVNTEKEGVLYYIKFPIKGGEFITIATTRPETLVGDVAVMVNPNDKRYKGFVGKSAILPLVNREIPIIADEYVDPQFGTGAVKVTPSHDFNDFEVAKKHNLKYPPIIGLDGKIKNTRVIDGLYVKQARVKVLDLLSEKNLLVKEEKHKMVLRTCYKCKNVLEPLSLEQWFVKVNPLTEKAIKAVRDGKIKIIPSNFENIYFQWLENLRDWNISRQIVWGIRIPAWKNKKTGEWIVTEGEKPKGDEWEQDHDTFDTWFSSGQWPFVTLKTTKPGDFEKFYPTSVMETGYDILKAWVSRMIMVGIYITGDVPFRDVLVHGLVNDPYGKKMSKSKGNVVNPLELIEKYGADSVRFALVYGNATGNDQSLSYSKLDAARKFTNKLWNMARFITLCHPELISGSNSSSTEMPKQVRHDTQDLLKMAKNENDKEMVKKTQELVKEVTGYLDKYQFNLAAERLYDFAWHEFADKYIEDVKNRIDEHSFVVLSSLFLVQLKLLHPFMPFVTEEIYQRFKFGESIMIDKWPA